MNVFVNYIIGMYRRNRKNSKGLALLEYAAGAVVIASVFWGAMNAFGNGLTGFFESLGGWLATQAANIPNVNQ